MTTTTNTTTRNYLTLADFRATRTEHADVSAEFGYDTDDGKPQPGFVYADCCYIEANTSRADYFLCVERSTWEGPEIEPLESILWAEHYLFDTADVVLSREDGTLDDFVRAICESHRKPCDGDLWGVVFSQKDAWTPSEARAEMIKHLFPAQAAGACIGPKPASEVARMVADMLNAGAVREISGWLAQSAKLSGLDPLESRAMVRAADALDTIMTWQTKAA